MKIPRRPSIYSGSTLAQVRAAARRREDERLMIAVLEGLFYSQDDCINGVPAGKVEPRTTQVFTISTSSIEPDNTDDFQEIEWKKQVAVNG